MDTNKKKTLEQEVTELKAAMFDNGRSIRNLAEDNVKLRAEVVHMRQRVTPEILGGVFTDIKKQQNELEEMLSQFRELAEECAGTFDRFATWAQKKVDAKKP